MGFFNKDARTSYTIPHLLPLDSDTCSSSVALPIMVERVHDTVQLLEKA